MIAYDKDIFDPAYDAEEQAEELSQEEFTEELLAEFFPEEFAKLGIAYGSKLDDDVKALLLKRLVDSDLAVTINKVCWKYQNIKKDVDFLDDMISKLTKKKKRLLTEEGHSKTFLQYLLDCNGLTKFKTLCYTVYPQKTAKALHEELSFSLNAIPERYIRVKKELDKTAIKEAIKAGELTEADLEAMGLVYAGSTTLTIKQ
jgi:phage host-nuclease inhibitor protein Gam